MVVDRVFQTDDGGMQQAPPRGKRSSTGRAPGAGGGRGLSQQPAHRGGGKIAEAVGKREQPPVDEEVQTALDRAQNLLSQLAVSSGLVASPQGSPTKARVGFQDGDGGVGGGDEGEGSPGKSAYGGGLGSPGKATKEGVMVERYFGRGKDGSGGPIAILIREDGTGEARYPNGSVAVSVSGSQTQGFSITAMYRNGSVAITADADGNAMVRACLHK